MNDWLRARAAVSPEALALQIGEAQWTYGELDGLVDGWAGWLLAQGVTIGVKVGVLLPNCLDYVCLVHALARAGGVLVPLNTRLTADELAWQVEFTECALLLVNEKTAVSLSPTLNIPIHNLSTRDPATPQPHNPDPFSLDNLQAIVFSSGTTGRPKGIMLTFGNHFWSATASAFRLGLDVNDRWLSCLPLYHVGGLAVLFRSCLYGTAVILHERFVTETVSDSLDRDRATLISLVPTMVFRLLQYRGKRPWAGLRHLLLGGAAATPELVARCDEVGIPLSVSYGLTEAASQVATLLPDVARQKPGSVGKPLMFSRVRIATDDGCTAATGEYGEVCVSGPTVMAGYYKNDTATAKTLVDGELRTGDIGYLDAEGDLWLVQRRSDLIVSGGENIYPAEVEAALRQHPQVAEVAVVGVPHPEWGQQVAAAVVRKTADLEATSLTQFAREKLAGYKLPRRVHFVEKLPQTASGKISRRDVKDLFDDR